MDFEEAIQGLVCPYCGRKFVSAQDAAAHAALCERHPKVVRSAVAEAELSALAPELETRREAGERGRGLGL